MKHQLERKKQDKSQLLDDTLLERQNRLLNNRLKSHEFIENGIKINS